MAKIKFPQIKKDIKDFLTREEGNMIKKDVIKLGLGLLVVGIGLDAAMKADPARAGTCYICNGGAGHPAHCSHSNHSSHSSHSSHSNHSSHVNY